MLSISTTFDRSGLWPPLSPIIFWAPLLSHASGKRLVVLVGRKRAALVSRFVTYQAEAQRWSKAERAVAYGATLAQQKRLI